LEEPLINSTGNPTDPTPKKFFECADTERLLATIVALGAEVYVLKAELKRLQVSLSQANVVNDLALEKAAASDAYRTWQAQEEVSFGRELLRPFVHPNDSHDVSDLMSGIRPGNRDKR
jgi:hypothetical protein